ncbi:hypothetical protein CC86DRAFT_411610 [Ophiobolus disseminans]|uniref:Uncharacterized protein n=1 Tax=Ophiobolus disseminans TaxID=1469910 RepID=A0A6A6ZKN1_9PLEO|nr:hypothetical protein CC86DRAFT_411610 [Ophiobolus disseminans]
MAGSLMKNLNIFEPNSFNIHANVTSAAEFLNLVCKKKIPLQLIPTECAKDTLVDPNPFQLSVQRYRELLGNAHPTMHLIEKYLKFTNATRYPAFDLIAAVAVKHPKSFKWKKIEYTVVGDRTNPSHIEFKEASKWWPSFRYHIKMASGDKGCLAENEDKILKTIQDTMNIEGM